MPLDITIPLIPFPADDAPQIEWALAWARFGVPVSPAWGASEDGATCDCLAHIPAERHCKNQNRGKHPATFHGHNDATLDEAQIRQWWNEYPNANIVGAIGAGGFVAVDLDLKNNKDGFESLADLEIEYGDMPATLTFETASGNSQHLLYRGATASHNGLRPGLDVKSTGGFIILPGSRIGAKRYRVLHNRPVANCPEWFSSLVGQPRERDASKKTDATEDLPGAAERFADFLRRLPPPTEGTRNDALAKIIAPRANDMGVTAETAIALTCEIWNENDGAASLSDSEIAKTIESGMRSAENPFGYLDELHRSTGLLERFEPAPPKAINSMDAIEPHVSLMRLGDITIRPVQWLVKDWIALGVLQIIAGKPGDAKTTLAISLGAVITAGGMLPDGEWTDALGDVLMWSGEDPRDTVLAPRFLAAGADPNRVHIVGEVRTDGTTREFDPATDMALLYAAAEKIPNLKLAIVDPVIVMVAGDSNQSNQVRRGLQPLRDFAERFNCAVIGITHFRKAGRDGETGDILSRVLGSQAFTAAARLVLVTARRPDDKERVLIRAKSNLGPDGGGFVYSTAQEPVPGHPAISAQIIQWCETMEGRPAELMASFEKGESKRGNARVWLYKLLRDAAGPVAIADIKARAAVELPQTSWVTIKRAAAELAVSGAADHRRKEWQLESKLSNEIDFPAD